MGPSYHSADACCLKATSVYFSSVCGSCPTNAAAKGQNVAVKLVSRRSHFVSHEGMSRIFVLWQTSDESTPECSSSKLSALQREKK